MNFQDFAADTARETFGTPTVDITPRLPDNWRDLLASARAAGYPHSPKHHWAYRNFVRGCFPAHVDSTNPDVLEQLEAWWVLTQLPYDGRWQYWLTAPACEKEVAS